jgi:hypothetical protein
LIQKIRKMKIWKETRTWMKKRTNMVVSMIRWVSLEASQVLQKELNITLLKRRRRKRRRRRRSHRNMRIRA